jgi:hypothetical protein
VLTFEPTKKPRGKELSAADKLTNEILSNARVLVENAITGVKRVYSLKDVLQNTSRLF